MITEDQVVDLLVTADPARIEKQYRAVEGSVYLTGLQTKDDILQVEEPAPDLETGRNLGLWLVAAALIIVLATAGILILSVLDEAPVATTPNIEEPEPTPTTAPEAVVEPEPTTPTTAAQTTERVTVGNTGLPLFSGQTEPGDYEWMYPAINVVMTSDGEWRCVNLCSLEDEKIQSNGGFLIKSRVLGGYVALSDLGMSADAAREVFASDPDLIVGPLEVVEPAHPDADWTGSRFVVDIHEDAPMHTDCQQGGDFGVYPCVVVPFGGWDTGENGITVHGPVVVYVLTASNGETYFASPFWTPWPLPPNGDHEATNQHLEELVETIRFVD